MKNNAAIYVRLSNEDRVKGDNLDEQIQTCQEYADNKGLEVVGIYADDGVSGAKINRPGLNDAITDADEGKFIVLIVRSHTRFSRDVTAAGLLQEQFELAGVNIHYENLGGPIDRDTSAGIWTDGVMKIKAEAERADIRDRVNRGKYRAAREGKIVISWRVPYGYARKRHNADKPREAYTSLEVVPAEAAVVRRIFEDFLKGANYSQIARELNEKGILRHEPTPWTVKNVSQIIRSKTYAGTWHYGRYKAKTRRVGMKDVTERWTVPDNDPSVVKVEVEPIIYQATFDDAQIKAQTIARINAKQHEYFYLLRGLFYLRGVWYSIPCHHSKEEVWILYSQPPESRLRQRIDTIRSVHFGN